MLKIPIISISINEGLKNFINKLVNKNQYENKSKLIRDALLRLMSSMELEGASSYEISNQIIPITKKIVGNMMIVAPHDSNIIKKINKIESNYKDQIVSKNQQYYKNRVNMFIIFEGSVEAFQKIVVDFNSIKEIKNFRYLIVN